MKPPIYAGSEIDPVTTSTSENAHPPARPGRGTASIPRTLFILGIEPPTANITRSVQRVADIALSLIFLLAAFPLFALVAVAIRLDSAGPVLFMQERVGRNGIGFLMYKFRSMVKDADLHRASLWSDNERDGPVFKIKKDPRVTRVGRFLRRYSIDELPQIINVLKGEMSLVGPRPALLFEVEMYTPRQLQRLIVVPGLTGLWQVSGRANVSFEDSVEMDLRYIEKQSLWLNFWIILRTIPKVLSGDGAY